MLSSGCLTPTCLLESRKILWCTVSPIKIVRLEAFFYLDIFCFYYTKLLVTSYYSDVSDVLKLFSGSVLKLSLFFYIKPGTELKIFYFFVEKHFFINFFHLKLLHDLQDDPGLRNWQVDLCKRTARHLDKLRMIRYDVKNGLLCF